MKTGIIRTIPRKIMQEKCLILFLLIGISGCTLPSKYGFKKAEKFTVKQTDILLTKKQKITSTDSIAREEYILDIVTIVDSIYSSKTERSPVNRSIPEFEIFMPIMCDTLRVLDIDKIRKKHKNLLFQAIAIKSDMDNKKKKTVVRFIPYQEMQEMTIYEKK